MPKAKLMHMTYTQGLWKVSQEGVETREQFNLANKSKKQAMIINRDTKYALAKTLGDTLGQIQEESYNEGKVQQ